MADESVLKQQIVKKKKKKKKKKKEREKKNPELRKKNLKWTLSRRLIDRYSDRTRKKRREGRRMQQEDK